jgi:hypothetical protein
VCEVAEFFYRKCASFNLSRAPTTFAIRLRRSKKISAITFITYNIHIYTALGTTPSGGSHWGFAVVRDLEVAAQKRRSFTRMGVRQPARAGRDGETPKHSDFTPQSPVYGSMDAVGLRNFPPSREFISAECVFFLAPYIKSLQ